MATPNDFASIVSDIYQGMVDKGYTGTEADLAVALSALSDDNGATTKWIDLGASSAYAIAVEHGYTGTEEEWIALLMNITQNAQIAKHSADSAAESAASAKQSEEAIPAKKEEALQAIASAESDALQSVNTAGTTQTGNVNTAGQEQVQAVNSAGTTQVGLVQQEGSDQKDVVTAEGEKQTQRVSNQGILEVQAVANEGTRQTGLVTDEGDDQVARVTAEGTTQVGLVTAEGTTQVGNVSQEGADQIAAIEQKGAETRESIPEDYTALSKNVDHLNAKVDTKADAIEKTVSGNIITFDDAIPDTLLKTVKVNIEPVQAGTGDPSPDNVRPITGWTGVKVTRTGINLLGAEVFRDAVKAYIPQATFSEDEDGAFVGFWAGNTGDSEHRIFNKFKENTVYTFILRLKKNESTANTNLRILYSDGTYTTFIKPNVDCAVTDAETFAVVSDAGKTITGIIKTNAGGQTKLYYNDCGIFEGVHTVEEFEAYKGNTYSVEFPAEAGDNGTVYSGTLTVNEDGTGELVVTHFCEDGGNLTWTKITGNDYRNFYTSVSRTRKYKTDKPTVWSSNYKSAANNSDTGTSKDNYVWAWAYSDRTIAVKDTSKTGMTAEEFKTAMTGVQFVYELYTPLHYTLTAPQIKTLLGENNIFADTGDADVTYRQTTKSYIDQRINSTRKMIAGIETSFTASKPYSVGDMLIIGDELYKVTSAIASGGKITVDTNVVKTTVAEQLLALANA